MRSVCEQGHERLMTRDQWPRRAAHHCIVAEKGVVSIVALTLAAVAQITRANKQFK